MSDNDNKALIVNPHLYLSDIPAPVPDEAELFSRAQYLMKQGRAIINKNLLSPCEHEQMYIVSPGIFHCNICNQDLKMSDLFFL